MTAATIVAGVLVFLWQISLGQLELERAVYGLGFVPSELLGGAARDGGMAGAAGAAHPGVEVLALGQPATHSWDMPRDTEAHDPHGDSGPDGGTVTVRVWDLPTRLFHWSLVALMGLSWWSGKAGAMDLHIASGKAVLALTLFRIGWGILGSTTARFSDFVRGPRAAFAYLGGLRGGDSAPMAGHNPAGGLMIVAMLVVLLIQAGTGLFANDDIVTEAPLAHLVTKATSDLLTIIHKVAFRLMVGLVGLHLLAVLFHKVIEHENLVWPMITGRKAWPVGVAAPLLRFAHPAKALALLLAAALAVWGVTQL